MRRVRDGNIFAFPAEENVAIKVSFHVERGVDVCGEYVTETFSHFQLSRMSR